MSRVKILKSELWDNDLPPVCMVCGVKPGQTKHDTQAIHTPFLLSPLGILGSLISPKKMPFSVVCCNECKQGYLNEANMSKVFGGLYTFAFLSIPISVATQKMPQGLIIPAIAYFAVMLLHAVYYWTIGKKSAIRCVAMDDGTVSFEFPGGMWGVAYTTYKREKGNRKLGRMPANDGPGPGAMAQDQGPPPPGGTIVSDAPPPGSPLANEPKTGGGGIPLDGDDNGRIPGDLPEFLAAIKEGDSDKIGAILNAGGDIAEATHSGMNGLHIACIAGLMQMADMLIRRGLDVNSEMANGLTPMHLAVQSNNQGMVGLLLAKKGNPNHKNKDGRTPLHWCAAVRDSRLDSANRYKMAQVLVKGGGDINARDNNGKTPAELANDGGEGKVAEVFS